MSVNQGEIRKLERKAKSMLMDRDIPKSKMDIVRSLLKNNDLMPEERYNAIISLIQSCPVKADIRQKEIHEEQKTGLHIRERQPAGKISDTLITGPEESSVFVNSIHRKYKHLKFFKKRYLIHSNNRLGIGIKKRLIPTKRLLRVLKDVIKFHEAILSRLLEVMKSLLEDEKVQDPVDFNYMRIVRKWLIASPFVEYHYDTIKWMDKSSFESELKGFVLPFFSFQKLSIEVREKILQTVETTLRSLPEFQKEVINEKDPDLAKREKEKVNLEREKKVYKYTMLLRSVLPVRIRDDSKISAYLKMNYGISSYPEFLHMLMEALVFKRNISLKEIDRYYDINSPIISSSRWDYNMAELKKFGKDPESQKKRKIDFLRQLLAGYESLQNLLEYKKEGYDILLKAYEYQWKIVNRGQKDFEEIFEDDFLKFCDGCINFFNLCYVPIIEGTTIYLEDQKKRIIEGSIFGTAYFSSELKDLKEIIRDIHYLRTSNPTMTISRDEVKKIYKGQIKSMGHVESLLSSIGSWFYGLARKIQEVYAAHEVWERSKKLNTDPDLLRKPLIEKPSPDEITAGFPLPYYDCTIAGFERARSLAKLLNGGKLFEDQKGILVDIAAFGYQLAYECQNEDIYKDLQERKRIVKELRELVGK